MDELKALIAARKRPHSDNDVSTIGNRKFLTRGELDEIDRRKRLCSSNEINSAVEMNIPEKDIKNEVKKEDKAHHPSVKGKIVDLSSKPIAQRQAGEFLDLRLEKETNKETKINRFIKILLEDWECDLNERPDAIKGTAQGKMDYNRWMQTKEYLKPLQRKLKKREVIGDVLMHLNEIVEACVEREYTKAGDWYVKLAIGNAPWPIGVTMVGIHERTGRERIESGKVAHVMNDEQQRKYLTSVKRLMTYCQKRFPAVPSKCLN